MSKPTKAPAKIEVENIRLSYDKKSAIVARYVREKFDKESASVRTQISKEIGKIYEKMIPEVKKFSQEEQVKWFTFGSVFKLIGFGEQIEEHRPVGVIFISDSYPFPKNYDSYRGFEITATDKLLELVKKLLDLRKQSNTFQNDFNKLLAAVNTSKQLCEMVPELASLFPKHVSGTAGSPCMSLVPIELIRTVRASLTVEK